MFSRWLRPVFYLLLILALVSLVGVAYWEYLYQVSSEPGRNELRGGWAYILVISWPVYLALLGIAIAKRKQLTIWEFSVALLTLVSLATFLVVVWS